MIFSVVLLPLTFETFDAARTYMLGFGALAEVLELEELRQAVVGTARRALDFYGHPNE